MEIELKNETGGGVFLAKENGETLGEMTFVRAGQGCVIIDHTFIAPAHRGKHVGRELVQAAVVHARKNGMRIIPRCPYVAAEFARHPDYKDIQAAPLAEDGQKVNPSCPIRPHHQQP